MKVVQVIYGNRTKEFNLGKNGVRAMFCHFPMGEGDRHYVEVVFNDDSRTIVYDVDEFTQEKDTV